MLIAMREETGGNYGRSMIVREIDGDNLRRAKEIFKDYKERGIILDGDFDDPEWKLTNQIKNVGLTLLTFEGGFHKNAMAWIGCGYRCYQDCVKAYIAFNLGEVTLETLQEITRAFNKLAAMTSDEAAASTEYLNHIACLLQIIPGGNEERDYVIEALEERAEQSNWKRRKGKQRQLADFKTYLRFHDVLAEFWLTADKRRKLFYFPLYFWWNLTAILPLRPMEFLLTPRDCLRARNGENILTVRRTKLKGGMERIGYRIAEDYDLKEYVIHDALASELRSYLESTSNMPGTALGTLFLQAPHYNYINMSPGSRGRYYSYACMNTCLRYFYQDVIDAGGKDVARIHLGDTRHIAMTSLIISGGSPVICRELAGHSDIDVSSHYYSNISNLVECVTLERWRKAKGGNASFTGAAKYPVSVPTNMCRVNGGYCDAPSVKAGRIDECLKILDGHGHIGECTRCGHYLPDKQGVRLEFYDENAGKRQVDADSRYLIQMIEFVRKGIGHTEDIGSALLRLQRSSNHYGKCLWEKYGEADKLKWQDQKN